MLCWGVTPGSGAVLATAGTLKRRESFIAEVLLQLLKRVQLGQAVQEQAKCRQLMGLTTVNVSQRSAEVSVSKVPLVGGLAGSRLIPHMDPAEAYRLSLLPSQEGDGGPILKVIRCRDDKEAVYCAEELERQPEMVKEVWPMFAEALVALVLWFDFMGHREDTARFLRVVLSAVAPEEVH